MLEEHNIAEEIVTLLDEGRLTEGALLRYFERHSRLLQTNIDSARVRHGEKDLSDLIHATFPRYREHRDVVLANWAAISSTRDTLMTEVNRQFDQVPDLRLVPCLGLFSSGGWAQAQDGVHHLCVALEMPLEHVNILLAHETAHALMEGPLSTILDGFYNEGFAVYVSSRLCPGYADGAYLYQGGVTASRRWIRGHRQKIAEDAARPFQVLDPYHLFYFGSAFADHPRIGYLIGYDYLNFLGQSLSMAELRTFSTRTDENQARFEEFIAGD